MRDIILFKYNHLDFSHTLQQVYVVTRGHGIYILFPGEASAGHSGTTSISLYHSASFVSVWLHHFSQGFFCLSLKYQFQTPFSHGWALCQVSSSLPAFCQEPIIIPFWYLWFRKTILFLDTIRFSYPFYPLKKKNLQLNTKLISLSLSLSPTYSFANRAIHIKNCCWVSRGPASTASCTLSPEATEKQAPEREGFSTDPHFLQGSWAEGYRLDSALDPGTLPLSPTLGLRLGRGLSGWAPQTPRPRLWSRPWASFIKSQPHMRCQRVPRVARGLSSPLSHHRGEEVPSRTWREGTKPPRQYLLGWAEVWLQVPILRVEEEIRVSRPCGLQMGQTRSSTSSRCV